MSDGKTYEMLWDCQFCGTNANLGLTHRFCPSCGAPQNPASRYYPSDADKIEVKDHQFVGIDVTCPACNELNSAASEFCGQCGSPLTAGARASTLEAQIAGGGLQFESTGSRDVVKEQFDAEMQRIGVQQPDKPKNGGLNIKWIAIGVAVVAMIVAAIGFLTAKVEGSLVVSGHEWERSIDVQEYRNFTERNWRDSRPSGDNVVMGACVREQRSTNRVPDGQECHTERQDQGDGTYRERQVCETKYREEPVYDQMCSWSGQRWQHVDTLEASGDLNDVPHWPDTNLNCENQSRVGCERATNQQEHYWVLYQDDEKKDYRCDYPQLEWSAIPMESLWTAQIGRFVTTIDCASLQRQ
jgi:hypothetical protein